MADSVRAFAAIELPTVVKEQLATLVDKLHEARLHGIRWGNPWSMHLTLKFLGNVPVESVPEIQHAMDALAQKQCPFTLQVHQLGGFPTIQNPRVIWAGLAGDVEALIQFQDRLEKEALVLGFPLGDRTFTPHLTLGRVRDRLSPQELDRLALEVSAINLPEMAFNVTSVTLMQSILLPSGAEYRALGQIPFMQPLSKIEFQ